MSPEAAALRAWLTELRRRKSAHDDTRFPTRAFLPDVEPRDPLVRADLVDELVRRDPRLIAIVAPPGTGKTARSCQVAARLAPRFPTAWLNADQLPFGRNAFWLGVEAALRGAWPADTPARPARDDSAIDVAGLALDLHGLGLPMLLVIDALPADGIGPIRSELSEFLELTPPSLRVIVVASDHAAVRWSRLRLHDDLVEVGFDQLALTADELAGVLSHGRGVPLDPSTAARLHADSDGWIEVARHNVVDLLSRAGSPGLRPTDHFVDAVLDQIPCHAAELLVDLSMFPTVSADLASTVTGRSDAATLLELLADNDLLRRSRERSWYRWTEGLRRLAMARAQRTSTPQDIATRRSRAAGWFLRRGLPGAAVDHAIAARDWRFAATALHEATMTTTLEPGELCGWFDQLPDTAVRLLEVETQLAIVMAGLLGHEALGRRLTALDARETFPPGGHRAATTLRRLRVLWRDGDPGAFPPSTATVRAVDVPRTAQRFAEIVVSLASWLRGDSSDAIDLLRTPTDRVTAGPAAIAHLAAELHAGLADDGHEPSLDQAYASTFTSGDAPQLLRHLGVTSWRTAIVHASDDDHDNAARHFRCAIDRATAAGAGLLASTFAVDRVRRAPDDSEARRDALVDISRRTVDPRSRSLLLGALDRFGISPGELPIDAAGRLSPREHAVLRLLRSPLTLREIAVELSVSVNTVKSHTRSIYRKLGVNDRRGAVAAAKRARADP